MQVKYFSFLDMLGWEIHHFWWKEYFPLWKYNWYRGTCGNRISTRFWVASLRPHFPKIAKKSKLERAIVRCKGEYYCSNIFADDWAWFKRKTLKVSRSKSIEKVEKPVVPCKCENTLEIGSNSNSRTLFHRSCKKQTNPAGRNASLRMGVRRAAPSSQVPPDFEVISCPWRAASADQGSFLLSLFRKKIERFFCFESVYPEILRFWDSNRKISISLSQKRSR